MLAATWPDCLTMAQCRRGGLYLVDCGLERMQMVYDGAGAFIGRVGGLVYEWHRDFGDVQIGSAAPMLDLGVSVPAGMPLGFDEPNEALAEWLERIAGDE